MRSRGLSLAETVIAIFLFVGGALVCFELALSACRNGARVEQVTQATLIAESALDGIRNWAYQPDNYLNNWSVYDDQDIAWGDPPGYKVHSFLAADQRSPLSPCSPLSVNYPPRTITNSARVVRVEVSWGNATPRERLSLTALIDEPARNVRATNPLVIVRQPPLVDPVVVNTTTRLQAALYDSSDRPIDGLAWEWTVLPDWNSGAPGGGKGTLVDVPGDAMQSTTALLHHFYRGDPNSPSPPYLLPGWVVVRATCRYDGTDYALDSAPIQLETPP